VFKVVKKKEITKKKETKEKIVSEKKQYAKSKVDFSTFAIISTGSKQYYVAVGSVVEVEKLELNPKDKIVFDQVLLIGTPDDVKVGQPFVKGATVEAEVVRQFRDDKILVFKFKNKTGYKKTIGHRQHQTAIRINAIKF